MSNSNSALSTKKINNGSNRRSSSGVRRQGVFWICTIPHYDFIPYSEPNADWIWCAGQLELGNETSRLHWQFCVHFRKKVALSWFKTHGWDSWHAELTDSRRAEVYCKKSDTSVDGTQFEFGRRTTSRSEPRDWDAIWDAAIRGDLSSIPASIRFQSYRTICSIRADFAKPIGVERSCYVFWGPTGTDKSRDAWIAAGDDAYPKDPNTKFWCGYRGQSNVVMDEFRGLINISSLLRWLDRYPVNVEVKGSSACLCAKNFWITSNLPPESWYPQLDADTLSALMRRLNVVAYKKLLS